MQTNSILTTYCNHQNSKMLISMQINLILIVIYHSSLIIYYVLGPRNIQRGVGFQFAYFWPFLCKLFPFIVISLLIFAFFLADLSIFGNFCKILPFNRYFGVLDKCICHILLHIYLLQQDWENSIIGPHPKKLHLYSLRIRTFL